MAGAKWRRDTAFAEGNPVFREKTGRNERTIRTSGLGGRLAALSALATDDTFITCIIPAASPRNLPSASDGAHGIGFAGTNVVAQRFQGLGGAFPYGRAQRSPSITRTSSAEIPGSDKAWPASGMIRRSAFAHPCARSQAARGGQIMSSRP